jgi:hypothetical protein
MYFSCVGGIGEQSGVLAAPGSAHLDSLYTGFYTAPFRIRSNSCNVDN